jgi:phosphatidylglycerophosphatase A
MPEGKTSREKISLSIRGTIIIKDLSRFIATVGYTGYVPFAPGTFGSAIGLAFIILIKPDDSVLLVTLIAVFSPRKLSGRTAGILLLMNSVVTSLLFCLFPGIRDIS